MWWHDDYIYRRKVRIEAPSKSVPRGHPIHLPLGNVLRNNNKVREDFLDIEVVYIDEDDESHQLYRQVDESEDSLVVTFQLQENLPASAVLEDSYKVYYGNPELFDISPRQSPIEITDVFPNPDLYPEEELILGGWTWGGIPFTWGGLTWGWDSDAIEGGYINPWPARLTHDQINYTRPGNHWVDGFSSHRLARATVLIYATAFRVISSTGPDKAIMEVQVNGGRWSPIDLYAEEHTEYDAVYEEHGLDPYRMNEIRLRVAGRGNVHRIGDSVNIRGIEYVMPLVSQDMGEEVNDNVVWSSSFGGGS